jgi:hypothetical protein
MICHVMFSCFGMLHQQYIHNHVTCRCVQYREYVTVFVPSHSFLDFKLKDILILTKCNLPLTISSCRVVLPNWDKPGRKPVVPSVPWLRGLQWMRWMRLCISGTHPINTSWTAGYTGHVTGKPVSVPTQDPSCPCWSRSLFNTTYNRLDGVNVGRLFVFALVISLLMSQTGNNWITKMTFATR